MLESITKDKSCKASALAICSFPVNRTKPFGILISPLTFKEGSCFAKSEENNSSSVAAFPKSKLFSSISAKSKI